MKKRLLVMLGSAILYFVLVFIFLKYCCYYWPYVPDFLIVISGVFLLDLVWDIENKNKKILISGLLFFILISAVKVPYMVAEKYYNFYFPNFYIIESFVIYGSFLMILFGIKEMYAKWTW